MATNRDFAAKIGVTESYASYLRNGKRLPSGHLLTAIILRYELDPIAAMDAYAAGKESFGVFLNEHVFGVKRKNGDAEPAPAT